MAETNRVAKTFLSFVLLLFTKHDQDRMGLNKYTHTEKVRSKCGEREAKMVQEQKERNAKAKLECQKKGIKYYLRQILLLG